MKARVHITLKDGVRQGKYIELDLADSDREAAQAAVTEMCEKLLANTIIENYAIDID
jgi:phosphoribosylformylglycinamidine synthase